MSPDQHRTLNTERIAVLEARLARLEEQALTVALCWAALTEEVTGEAPTDAEAAA